MKYLYFKLNLLVTRPAGKSQNTLLCQDKRMQLHIKSQTKIVEIPGRNSMYNVHTYFTIPRARHISRHIWVIGEDIEIVQR